MYSRKKGKHGSKRPSKRTKQSWVRYDKKTIEQLVVKYGKAGKTASEIGLMLRDSYGIPDVKTHTGKKIMEILRENKLVGKVPDDLKALIKKDILIMKHMESNKKDMDAKRGLMLTESKILRLSRYYKEKGALPEDWTFDRTKAKLLIE